MGNTVIFVTHYPVLTRYASRVVYMRDGAILTDEQTKIGEVAPVARRNMYSTRRKTAEDDLAGVSALMGAMTEDEQSAALKQPRKRVTTSTRAKTATRRKK